MLGQVVRGLSDVRALLPLLQQHAQTHCTCGVQPEQFPAIGKALLWTLEQGLGECWTPEVKDAWTKTYDMIVKVIEPSFRAAQKGRPQGGVPQGAPVQNGTPVRKTRNPKPEALHSEP